MLTVLACLARYVKITSYKRGNGRAKARENGIFLTVISCGVMLGRAPPVVVFPVSTCNLKKSLVLFPNQDCITLGMVVDGYGG